MQALAQFSERPVMMIVDDVRLHALPYICLPSMGCPHQQGTADTAKDCAVLKTKPI